MNNELLMKKIYEDIPDIDLFKSVIYDDYMDENYNEFEW